MPISRTSNQLLAYAAIGIGGHLQCSHPRAQNSTLWAIYQEYSINKNIQSIGSRNQDAAGPAFENGLLDEMPGSRQA